MAIDFLGFFDWISLLLVVGIFIWFLITLFSSFGEGWGDSGGNPGEGIGRFIGNLKAGRDAKLEEKEREREALRKQEEEKLSNLITKLESALSYMGNLDTQLLTLLKELVEVFKALSEEARSFKGKDSLTTIKDLYSKAINGLKKAIEFEKNRLNLVTAILEFNNRIADSENRLKRLMGKAADLRKEAGKIKDKKKRDEILALLNDIDKRLKADMDLLNRTRSFMAQKIRLPRDLRANILLELDILKKLEEAVAKSANNGKDIEKVSKSAVEILQKLITKIEQDESIVAEIWQFAHQEENAHKIFKENEKVIDAELAEIERKIAEYLKQVTVTPPTPTPNPPGPGKARTLVKGKIKFWINASSLGYDYKGSAGSINFKGHDIKSVMNSIEKNLGSEAAYAIMGDDGFYKALEKQILIANGKNSP